VTSVGEQTSRGVGRVALLTLFEVAVAAVVAILVFRTFGAVSGADTNPPECYNASGGVVSCALTSQVLMLPTFAVVLLGLVVWQWRHQRVTRAQVTRCQSVEASRRIR
jgi:uncharacterized membrane protein